ncbi:MAG: helix-turn-helix transcriptional regulator [Bacteroidota bacterium]
MLIHTLPFLLSLITLLPLFLQNAETKIEILERLYINHQKVTGHYVLYSVVNILQFLFYNTLIFKDLKVRKLLKNNKSIQSNLQWVYRLMLIMNMIIVAYIMVYISFIISNNYEHIFILIFISSLLATIFLTTFHLIKNPFFFEKSFGTYHRSTLNKRVSIKLDKTLISFLKEEKSYLNPEIKIAELAKMLDVNTHQLSQFLNQKMNTTYNAMMNSLRIDHAKNMLRNDLQKEKTILSVALDSGFSNQSNFIRVFKNYTNLTPSQYRFQQINSVS